MIKVISGSEVKRLDTRHQEIHGISSWEMMEQAANSFTDWIVTHQKLVGRRIALFCGPGNNGGDGLAIARLLFQSGYNSTVFLCFEDSSKMTPDSHANLEKLPKEIGIYSWRDFKAEDFDFLIDSFLGVGIKGELRREASEVIHVINQFQREVISVDLPSGLPSDSGCDWECVKSSMTITFAFPKLSLLLPENAKFSGELVVLPIGIWDQEYEAFDSNTYYLRKEDVSHYHRKYSRFSHKGTFGKVLMVAGSPGKMGAAILCVKSALRTGSGLVSCLTPWEERGILQSAAPEGMVVKDSDVSFSQLDSIGIGPGIGIGQVELLHRIFSKFSKPMVLDADALTILANHPELLPLVPKESILTPHLGEFERLFGKSTSHIVRMKIAQEFCLENQLNLLIKGANSVICLSDGRQIFNSSGSKYMATGGSGDVLTGMLTSFLGQGYSSEQALICGVFHHGLAGEIAGKTKLRSTLASDILEAIPSTYQLVGID